MIDWLRFYWRERIVGGVYVMREDDFDFFFLFNLKFDTGILTSKLDENFEGFDKEN